MILNIDRYVKNIWDQDQSKNCIDSDKKRALKSPGKSNYDISKYDNVNSDLVDTPA